jgi:trehalose/maltose hydrolase-like predicted phosphorylase
MGALEETFEALIVDWDGTVVPDRQADAARTRGCIEALSAAGVHVFIVSGTHVGNVDGQLGARPQGPGQLHLCCNRGSEVFEVATGGPVLVSRRTASTEENDTLDRSAAETIERLRSRGLETALVSERFNRRKIDLIPAAEWANPKKAEIARLASAVTARLSRAGIADLGEVADLARETAVKEGLSDPRITSDVKHIEIGLTDKSDSARFAASWLAEKGITGALVLIAGDEFGPIGGVTGSDSLMMVDELERALVVSVGIEPTGVPERVLHLGGGPERFLGLLAAQLERRAVRRVPQIDPDPAWVFTLPTGRAQTRVAEALATLGNGLTATRGSEEEDEQDSSPLFLVSGVYGHDARLLPGPQWSGLELAGDRGGLAERRSLDLRTATLFREGGSDGMRSFRFVSAASPHVMALRAEAPEGKLEPGDPLRAPDDVVEFERADRAGVSLARTGEGDRAVAVAARDHLGTVEDRHLIERLVAWVAAPPNVASFDDACERLAEAEVRGFDELLAEHRETWARCWKDAEVVIEGDSESELAARFAVFHLLSTAAESGEAAVGARGLTGDAYAGHVFWDADVFVLPALAAIRPAAARAMLEYRLRRLPAARAAAAAGGLRGARFPWESADDGSDVTPRVAKGPHGEVIPIASGPHEEHIVADVAWAAVHYASWTGDAGFLAGAGRDLVVDTARYWASRIRLDAGGHGHLHAVMGPDEYHEVVDDNAYTNVMARWNLRRGAELLVQSGGSEEAQAWRDLAERLVDGWSSESSLYEQFSGYFDLEPLLMSEIAPPPVAVDVLLGAARVAGSQLIKQADVLMLHHLVPEELVAGSLSACLAFYEPRTAHGSSLSPAIHASLLARAGETERALELFRLAAHLDLDDLTGTTAGGLHLATMGGLWQALAYGFLGLRVEGAVLGIDPRLPAAWTALSLSFRFRGQHLTVRGEHDQVSITCEAPLVICLAGRAPQLCEPPGVTVATEASPSDGSRR